MTPRFLFVDGSMTETVLEYCSAAYTRSFSLMGNSGALTAKGACPAHTGKLSSRSANASDRREMLKGRVLIGRRRGRGASLACPLGPRAYRQSPAPVRR